LVKVCFVVACKVIACNIKRWAKAVAAHRPLPTLESLVGRVLMSLLILTKVSLFKKRVFIRAKMCGVNG
jgi:hypothetical protein